MTTGSMSYLASSSFNQVVYCTTYSTVCYYYFSIITVYHKFYYYFVKIMR